MDPPLIHECPVSAANPSSYSLAELWPFPGSASTAVSGGGLGLRIGNLDALGESVSQRDCLGEESTVTELSGGCIGRKRRDLSSGYESSKVVSTSSSATDVRDLNGKRMKTLGCEKEKGCSKVEVEASSGAGGKSELSSKPPEPPKDYIHVRARRGQATDSHSLAERARREKISEQMKILQDLVPGCNKIIGKALVLDEIINYIQSLQQQVELLSMKLEAVNSRMNVNPSVESFHSKDEFDGTGLILGSQVAKEYDQGPLLNWLHMQGGGSSDRTL